MQKCQVDKLQVEWQGTVLAVDTETVSLKDKTLLGVSICDGVNAYYFSTEKFRIDKLIQFLKPILEGEYTKVFHNAKFDLAVFRNYGLTVNNFEDTLILSWLCETGRRKKFGLKELAKDILDAEVVTLKDIGFTGDTSLVNKEQLADYAMDDVIYTYKLYKKFRPKIKGAIEQNYLKIELPIVEILSKMEARGITVDIDKLETLNIEMGVATAKMYEDLVLAMIKEGYHPGGKKHVSPNSPLQVVNFLAHLGIHTDSSDRKTLSKIKHPWVAQLLKYKKDFKLYSTYVHNLLPEIKENHNKLKGSFSQTGTDTGRFSSSQPNLQNLPAHDDYEYRSIFIASPQKVLLVADYSQIELRTLAHLSKDKQMIDYFLAGYDLHSATAHGMYKLDCPIEEVKDKYPEVRFKAKAINFGLIYGMGPASLGEQIGVSEREAKKLIAAYFQQFPSIQEYIGQIQQFALDRGYVTTIFGRKRYFPEVFADSETRRQAYGSIMRRAINTKIQGSAADIMKAAMVKVDALGVDILLQVHDEIVMEVDEDTDILKLVKETMENAVKQFRVPLVVDIKKCTNWLAGK